MRRPPPLSQLIHYPVTGGVCLLAIVASFCHFAGYNIELIEMHYPGLHGEPWRLITTIFPHANAFHLFFNLYWVWAFGSIIEEEFGSIRTAMLMAMLAAGSSAAEYAFAGSGIGLSGVGYGLFGFLWVLSRYHRSLRDAVDSNTAWLFVVWFFLCIALTLSNYLPVANVAHGVGCLLGAIAGFAVAAPGGFRMSAQIGLAICLILIGLLSTIGRRYVNFTLDGGGELARMADSAFSADDNSRAAHFLEEAVSYRRTESRWWFNLYVAYERLGRHRDAIAALEHAPMIDPASRELKGKDLAILGGQRLTVQDYRGAADYLRRAINAGQESQATWGQLALAYVGLNEPDNANAAFEHAKRFETRNATSQSAGE